MTHSCLRVPLQENGALAADDGDGATAPEADAGTSGGRSSSSKSAPHFTPEELQGILQVAQDDDPFGLVVSSLCPSIFGHEIVKVSTRCRNEKQTDNDAIYPSSSLPPSLPPPSLRPPIPPFLHLVYTSFVRGAFLDSASHFYVFGLFPEVNRTNRSARLPISPLISLPPPPQAGLVLGLFGGTSRNSEVATRCDPHVLVVGDPGLGKSQVGP